MNNIGESAIKGLFQQLVGRNDDDAEDIKKLLNDIQRRLAPASEKNLLTRIKDTLRESSPKYIEVDNISVSDRDWLSFRVLLNSNNATSLIESLEGHKSTLASLLMLFIVDCEETCELTYHIQTDKSRCDGSRLMSHTLITRILKTVCEIDLTFIPSDTKLKVVVNSHGNGFNVELKVDQ